MMSDKKLSIISLLIVVILCVSAWFSQLNIERELRGELGKSLSTVLSTTNQAITSWVLSEQNDVKVWANLRQVKGATKSLLGLPRISQSLINAPIQAELRNFLAPVLKVKGHQGYFIIAPDHVSLASSRDENIGTVNLLIKQKEFFSQIWAGRPAMSTPLVSDVLLPDELGVLRESLPTMFVGSPVFDERGEVIAAFVFRLDPHATFTAVLQRGQIGESGETYAFNRAGLMISLSRYDDQLREFGLLSKGERGVLNISIRDPGVNLLDEGEKYFADNQLPLTYMAQDAINGGSGVNVEGYRDYRGVPVLGAWTWNEVFDFGLTTEINADEALLPITHVRYTVIVLLLITVLLLTGLTVVFILNRKHLAQSEKELRLILDHAPISMVLTDSQGFIELFNKKFIDVFGWTRTDVRTPEQWWKAVYPDEEYRQQVQTSWQRATENAVELQSEIEPQQWRMTCKSGEVRNVEFSMSSVSDKHSIISLFDITEKMKAASVLKYERDKAKSYLDTVETIVVALDKAGDILLLNRRGCEVLGYEGQELVGKNWFDVCLPGDNGEYIFDEVFSKVMDGDMSNLEYVENEVITRGGNLRLIAWHNGLLRDSEGEVSGTLSAGQDITDFRKAENERADLQRRLLQSQKMEAIGLLAGGVAHNFNNVLASMIGFTELAIMEATKLNATKIVSHLDRVIANGSRASDLVKQMLAFGRKRKLNLEPRLLHEMILGSLGVLKSVVPPNVSIEDEFQSVDDKVMVDVVELRQILISLCLNASEAMSGEGTIKIGLYKLSKGGGECHSCFNKISGENVVIEISDGGRGIASDDLSHLFDPFFTSKGLHEGAGMGLPMVHGILHEHNGHIQIESELNVGTRVRLYFPVC